MTRASESRAARRSRSPPCRRGVAGGGGGGALRGFHGTRVANVLGIMDRAASSSPEDGQVFLSDTVGDTFRRARDPRVPRRSVGCCSQPFNHCRSLRAVCGWTRRSVPKASAESLISDALFGERALWRAYELGASSCRTKWSTSWWTDSGARHSECDRELAQH
jgi:hypothetical protein